MRRIIIEPVLFDPIGALALQASGESDRDQYVRRISAVATLDGSRDFEDRGFTDSDRTVTIIDYTAGEAEHNHARHLIRNHSRVFLYMQDGAYSAMIETVDYNNGALSVTLLITKREIG